MEAWFIWPLIGFVGFVVGYVRGMAAEAEEWRGAAQTSQRKTSGGVKHLVRPLYEERASNPDIDLLSRRNGICGGGGSGT